MPTKRVQGRRPTPLGRPNPNRAEAARVGGSEGGGQGGLRAALALMATGSTGSQEHTEHKPGKALGTGLVGGCPSHGGGLISRETISFPTAGMYIYELCY
jgi:hypothetical protein